MADLKTVSAEHVAAALDAVLGLDPTQAPRTAAELGERLSRPQPGVVQTLSLIERALPADPSRRTMPLVFCLVEAAHRAHADLGEINPKVFAGAIPAAANEARTLAVGGPGTVVPIRERQPELVAFVDKHLVAPDSFAAKLNEDTRLGVIALGLGTVRAIDRALNGAEPPVHVEKQPGRNDPCPCGSGKKYKKCHGAAA